MQEGTGGLLPSEDLTPLYSLDSQAIRYHLLPLPLMHKFRGAPLEAPPLGRPSVAPLPQTPPPERVKGPPPTPPARKRGKGKKAAKRKKKKGAPKGALKGGPGVAPAPSSLLPTVESYWGPLEVPRERLEGASLAREAPDELDDEPVGYLHGVHCLDATRNSWMLEKDLRNLLGRVGDGLRCLSLAGCNVGQETEKSLSTCCR